MLPTDHDNTAKVAGQTKREVVLFCAKVAQQSMEKWNDVHPRVAHCFLSRVGRQTGADRCESQHEGQCREGEQLAEDDGTTTGLPDLPTEAAKETSKTPHAEDELPEAPHGQGGPDLSPKKDVSSEPAILAVSASEKNLEKIHHDKHNDDTCMGPCGYWMSKPYEKDDIPEDNYKLKKRYRAIPEVYYSTSGPPSYTSQLQGLVCQSQRSRSTMACLGNLLRQWTLITDSADGRISSWISGRLSLRLGYQQLRPPADALAGAEGVSTWLHALCSRLCSMVSGWKLKGSYGATKRDWPGLSFVQDSCQEQSIHGRGYGVEQPLGSAMWQALPENPLRLGILGDYKNKQRVDQCMHGSVDENKFPVQKATALGSNVKWTRTALRCSGHGGVQHAHLQGQGPGGVARTATAAVYPKLMCQRMKMDIINFLYNRKLMNVKKWPRDMTYHTTGHYYDCIRCQLGRMCPRDIPHSFVPRECRHGRWAPGTGPRARSTMPPDPLAEWKRKADSEVLEAVELNGTSAKPLPIQQRHWLKKLLLEMLGYLQ